MSREALEIIPKKPKAKQQPVIPMRRTVDEIFPLKRPASGFYGSTTAPPPPPPPPPLPRKIQGPPAPALPRKIQGPPAPASGYYGQVAPPTTRTGRAPVPARKPFQASAPASPSAPTPAAQVTPYQYNDLDTEMRGMRTSSTPSPPPTIDAGLGDAEGTGFGTPLSLGAPPPVARIVSGLGQQYDDVANSSNDMTDYVRNQQAALGNAVLAQILRSLGAVEDPSKSEFVDPWDAETSNYKALYGERAGERKALFDAEQARIAQIYDQITGRQRAALQGALGQASADYSSGVAAANSGAAQTIANNSAIWNQAAADRQALADRNAARRELDAEQIARYGLSGIEDAATARLGATTGSSLPPEVINALNNDRQDALLRQMRSASADANQRYGSALNSTMANMAELISQSYGRQQAGGNDLLSRYADDVSKMLGGRTGALDKFYGANQGAAEARQKLIAENDQIRKILQDMSPNTEVARKVLDNIVTTRNNQADNATSILNNQADNATSILNNQASLQTQADIAAAKNATDIEIALMKPERAADVKAQKVVGEDAIARGTSEGVSWHSDTLNQFRQIQSQVRQDLSREYNEVGGGKLVEIKTPGDLARARTFDPNAQMGQTITIPQTIQLKVTRDNLKIAQKQFPNVRVGETVELIQEAQRQRNPLYLPTASERERAEGALVALRISETLGGQTPLAQKAKNASAEQNLGVLARAYYFGYSLAPKADAAQGAALGTASRERVVQTAKKYLGVNEVSGTASAWLKLNAAETAWCQAAVNQVFREAGLPLPNQNSLGTRNSYEMLRRAGMGSSRPVVGGLAYKTRPGENKGHVGIVVSYDPSTGIVRTVEGNTKNSMQTVSRRISDWDLGFIDPFQGR